MVVLSPGVKFRFMIESNQCLTWKICRDAVNFLCRSKMPKIEITFKGCQKKTLFLEKEISNAWIVVAYRDP